MKSKGLLREAHGAQAEEVQLQDGKRRPAVGSRGACARCEP